MSQGTMRVIGMFLCNVSPHVITEATTVWTGGSNFIQRKKLNSVIIIMFL